MTRAEDDEKGLSGKARSEWGPVVVNDQNEAIDVLKPGSELHKRVYTYLSNRVAMSERAMAKFHARWNYSEYRIQAYLNLQDSERLLKEANEKGRPASMISVSVPYTFSTVSTIVTYQLQAFAGRKPIFSVGSNKAETAEAASKMETLLQYQADHTRYVKYLYGFLQDAQTYGFGAMRILWDRKVGNRTVWRKREAPAGLSLLGNIIPQLGAAFSPGWVSSREERLLYAGANIETIDPFMFLPDPRVPMNEVNKKGEFVFWRTFIGVHELKIGASQGMYKHVESVGSLPRANTSGALPNASLRNIKISGDTDLTQAQGEGRGQADYVQVDEGTCMIIPAELGLGQSNLPERWLFTIANKKQIIRAERFDFDHDMHPVVVTEPYSTGYGFGMPGIVDWLGPLQDSMSWFINSHMHNVASSINNMFVVDPSMVEMQDLNNPGAGKRIRLKRQAYGQDVRTAIAQLPVADVTRGHVQDLDLMFRIADGLSSVTDNLRGLQDQGGRKTATEVRVATEAGASRLASNTRLISAQAMVDLTTQLSLNTQQFLDQEISVAVLGQDGRQNFMEVTPDGVVGDFNFPVHDGTLPIDKVAMLDVWQQILMGVAQDPELRQAYSLPKIFEYVAELGGARNIEEFKMQQMPDEQIERQLQAGNIVPLGDATSGLPGGSPGPSAPGNSLAGALG